MPLLRVGIFVLYGIVFIACDGNINKNSAAFIPLASTPLSDSTENHFNRFGRFVEANKLNQIYTYTPLDSFDFPIVHDAVLEGLRRQKLLLKLRKQRYNQRIGNLQVNLSQLNETADLLEQWQHIVPLGIEEELEAHQIWGKDRKGNVQFTGYFSPIIKVSRDSSAQFPHPIYTNPKSCVDTLPSRAAIAKGALDSCNNVLAYAQSKVDIYFMQLQGSGYVEYPNGKQELFAYDGQNGYPYRSIEQYLAGKSEEYGLSDISMDGIKRFLQQRPELVDTILNVNPSYIFFRKSFSTPVGAGLVPLTPKLSVAVDTRYIPLGSTLLAAMPKLDKKGEVVGHEYQLFLAQDVGGAIKGAGHIDVYFGAGKEAKEMAKNFNYYGKVWLLLPNQRKLHGFDPAFSAL